ncbi:MAG TPA: hypothetical protein VNE62_09230 [Actinomycetota bacterium]|nr:hypothetical protein [Actinomycetota bacterium]
MEIKITCRACDRTYPIAMAVDPEGRSGHCPFCGESLAFQYSSTFIESVERVMRLGPEFVRQLTLLAELAGGFRLEPESLLGPVREAVARQDERVAEPYRPTWPPAPSEPVA